MMPSTIKSRPSYAGLRPIPTARRNIVTAEGEGIEAVLRLLGVAPAGFGDRTHLLYAETAGSDPERRSRLVADRVEVLPDAEGVYRALHAVLTGATMGTRLYAAGTEGFVGGIVRVAIEHGIDHRSVLTEHSGSLARRVQCVHCKYMTEGVTVSVFECAGCGTLLFVRDHYSRRLAAFQGVCVNAEDPTERPAPEELYP